MCPWTIVRSWEHLPFSPLPFSPSLFLSFSFSSLHPLPWASLDAFVIAGSPSFLGCVLGRLCRSWEHLCFLLSLLLFSSSPPPSFLARGVFTSKLGFCNRFLNEVWTVIGLSPFIWFPFHPPPQTFFFLLFFHVLLSSCLFILILSFSCAHYRPDLSLYTYTHAYSTYSKVQVAQVRYNEVWLIGCPSSLGSFSSATTHTHLCLSRPFHFHLSLLRAHVPTSFPGRMEVTHASLRGGVCVCVTLGITGILLDCSCFCFFRFAAGELGTLWLTQFNEARSQSGIFGLIIRTYLQFSNFPPWREAKPRTSKMLMFLLL